jgi:hypothetical protein
MNKLVKMLLKNKDFYKKYFSAYFKLLKKPIIFSIIGVSLLALCLLGPIGALIALFISIPCLCYAFWQGYLITYSLIYAADAYSLNDEPNLIDCYETARTKGNTLAIFLLFSMILSLVLMFPTLVTLVFSFDITTLQIKPWFYIIAFINSVLLFPFSNFLNQAFFYRKHEEKFIDLFLNCYKKLDKIGILISILFSIFMGLLYAFNSIFYIILALIFNPLIYCINTLWYKSKSLSQQEF